MIESEEEGNIGLPLSFSLSVWTHPAWNENFMRCPAIQTDRLSSDFVIHFLSGGGDLLHHLPSPKDEKARKALIDKQVTNNNKQ